MRRMILTTLAAGLMPERMDRIHERYIRPATSATCSRSTVTASRKAWCTSFWNAETI
jgi:hypothetical protein